MTLTSPALQRAQTAMLARRRGRGPSADNIVSTARHESLRRAYSATGDGIDGQPRYLIILYCPSCLRGHAVDLVRDVPDGLPSAHELGLRQSRPWRIECASTS